MIGIYIGRTALDSTYGAAASLVVVLVWIYYSSLILFLGAEFTHVYAQRRGSQTGAMDAARLQPAAKRESQATARAVSR